MFFFPDFIPNPVQYLITVSGILVCGGAALLYIFQCELIYAANFPPGSRQQVSKPTDHGIYKYEDVTLTTKDNVNIRAYVCRQVPEATARISPTILFFHANAGNMGHRLPIAKKFYIKYKCNVVLLSYRGYGLSEGKANEKGIQIDAQCILDHIRNHDVLKDTKIIVYGQSVGGAVAIYLVSRNESDISGLIVENTFLSIPKLIPHVLPQLKHFTFLCHQNWPSEIAIRQIVNTPILFLTGAKDELVPPEHMRQLYELAETRGGKVWKEFVNGTHNDTVIQPGYFETIGEFIENRVMSFAMIKEKAENDEK
ncbi:14352_t:CDS:2 [Ambispora leptoticha]|uniref:14352_t:CDS:1 n=1 Tax=Ambispora leptoticha TaxID=144679 RepID=A0A9N8VB98_9GLOM|nr:14352_t:CDS:2 [Ambispora leptoticha]